MRALWWSGGIAAIVVLGAVQAASLALFGSLGANPSLPRAATGTWPYAVSAATGLDALPPVRVALVRAALLRGDVARAAALAGGLPEGETGDDLRGRIALAQGHTDDAVAAFAAAGDIVAAEAAIDAVGQRDPLAAYRLAAAFADAAARRGEPVPVRAEAAWRAGERAAVVAAVHPADAPHFLALALRYYREAATDDPTQEAYLLAEGFGSLVTGAVDEARAAYRRAVAVVPDSVDGWTGLALSDASAGDCAAALNALAHARAAAGPQRRTVDLRAAAPDDASRAAVARCAGS
jgi:tetratricopeptide (TPR) repeat protein